MANYSEEKIKTMKKLIFMCAMLFAVLSANAQSEQGTWMTLMEQDDANIGVIIGMAGDHSAILKLVVESKDEEIGSINVIVDAEGTYTRNGDKLLFDINADDMKISIGEVEWSEDIKKDLGENKELEKMLLSVFRQSVVDNKGELVDMMKGISSLTILSIDKETMVIKDNDDVLTFKKVQRQ